jgi:hypothetical protein
MWLPTSAGRIGRGQGQAPVVRHNGRNSASPSPTGWRRCDDRCSFGRGRRSRPESRARGLGGVVSDCSCPEDGFGRHYSFIASPPIWCRWSRPLACPSEESGGAAARRANSWRQCWRGWMPMATQQGQVMPISDAVGRACRPQQNLLPIMVPAIVLSKSGFGVLSLFFASTKPASGASR